MNLYNEYEEGCWEEGTIDPLRDPNRLQGCYDPFWELSIHDPTHDKEKYKSEESS